MSGVFFISDTHFNHRKVIDFEASSRPFQSIEEHDETLIANWNRVVRSPKDIVWHLGERRMMERKMCPRCGINPSNSRRCAACYALDLAAANAASHLRLCLPADAEWTCAQHFDVGLPHDGQDEARVYSHFLNVALQRVAKAISA